MSERRGTHGRQARDHRQASKAAASTDLFEAKTLPASRASGGKPSSLDPHRPHDVPQGVKRWWVIDPHGSSGTKPSQMGRYVLLNTLGKGGMGIVFEAFDRSLDRRVAVKILHRADSRRTKRLLREARSLAKLSHPNVVQVYEVGEIDGQTFVAMELIRGQTIREWLERLPPPGWRECVEMFIQLGQGLAAAHGQGLVHRDFKPDNAVVDEQGRARVLDFGLARQISATDATEDPPSSSSLATTITARRRLANTVLTRTGSMLGTPAYMAPEQLSGRTADARSDQFTFCVSLYEALYGERPYGGSSLATLTGATVRPPPAGTAVPRTLRKVLLRGLAIEREQRWPSMDALLAELRLLVKPRRWARGVLGGALALGLVMTGTAGVYQAHVADRAERTHRAELARRCSGAWAELQGTWDDERRQQVQDAISSTELSYASSTWERVQSRLDDYAQAWATKYTEVCEATAVRHEQSARERSLRMRCLDEHRTVLSARVRILADADAQLLDKAVDLVADLPAASRCDDLARLEQRQRRLPPPHDPHVARQVQTLRDQLADIEATREAGRFHQALEQAEQVVPLAEALGYGPLLAEARWHRGCLKSDTGEFAEAEQELLRAYELAVRHDHVRIEFEAAGDLAHVVGAELQRHDEGGHWARVTRSLAERMGGPLERATSMDILGLALEGQGKYEDAEQVIREGLAISEEALGTDHPEIAHTRHNLGIMLYHQGKYEQAEAMIRGALRASEQAQGRNHPNMAELVLSLSTVLGRRGRHEEVGTLMRELLATLPSAVGNDHPSVAASIGNLATALDGQGKYEEAEAMYRRALEVWQNAQGNDHPGVADAMNNVGQILHRRGKYEESEAMHREALNIKQRVLGGEHPSLGHNLHNLGVVLAAQGKFDDAKIMHGRALELKHNALGDDHPEVAMTLIGLGSLNLQTGDTQAARQHAERAVSIYEAATANPGLLAFARFLLARALWADETQRERAHALAEQARDALIHSPNQQDTLADVNAWLAEHRRG